MSTGNGDVTFSQRVTAGLTARTAEMSALERSAQADAMRRQLVELTAAHNLLVALVKAQGTRGAASEQCCQERWDVSAEASKRAGDRHQAFVGRSFGARLRWLVRGR